jgi:hypothetical protein
MVVKNVRKSLFACGESATAKLIFLLSVKFNDVFAKYSEDGKYSKA